MPKNCCFSLGVQSTCKKMLLKIQIFLNLGSEEPITHFCVCPSNHYYFYMCQGIRWYKVGRKYYVFLCFKHSYYY